MARGRLLVFTFVAAAAFVGPLAGDEEALNRSLYVPVEFVTCEHLEGATLYRGESPLRELPGRHVFQFTYYPKLGRLLPELERVRVVGTHGDETFEAGIVVTPASVHVGKKRIALDLEAQRSRFRRSLDARHEKVELTLRCEHRCDRLVARNSGRGELEERR